MNIESESAISQAKVIKRTLDILCEPGNVHEIRVPGTEAGILAGWYDGRQKQAWEALNLTKGGGKYPSKYGPKAISPPSSVYLMLNPVSADFLAVAGNRMRSIDKGEGSKDADIIRLKRLYLDFDPWRRSGISSTEVGHNRAIERAGNVRDDLSALGFPLPLFGDSGNGTNLVYGIDLPNDVLKGKDSVYARLVEDFVHAIAQRYSDDCVKDKTPFDDSLIHVDPVVFNPARIATLYGTMKRKGDATPTRPHRLSCILESPEKLEPIPEDLLRLALESLKPVNKVTVETGSDYQADKTSEEPEIPDFLKTEAERLDNTEDKDWFKHYSGNLRTLNVEALWKSKGLSCEPQGEGKPYKVQCPKCDRHSDSSLGGTVLFKEPGKFPHFHCERTDCRTEYGKGNRQALKNVLAWFGKEAVDACCSEHYVQRKTNGAPDKPRPKPVLLSVKEAREEAANEVIDPVWGGIQAGMLCVLTGLPNSGKTKILHTMIAKSAMGSEELFGLPLFPMRYVSIDPENRLTNTLRWFDGVLHEQSDNLEEVLTFIKNDSIPDALDPEYLQEIIDAIGQDDKRKTCIIVDTFRAAYIGDAEYNERDEKFIQAKLKALKDLANRTGVVLFVLHHHGWNDERASGSTAWWSVPDAVFSYHRKPDEPEGRLQRVRVRGNDDLEFPTLMIARDDSTGLLRSVGTLASMKAEAKTAKADAKMVKVLGLFPEEGRLTVAEVVSAIAKREGEELPRRTIERLVFDCFNAKYLERTGKGSKGNPYRYHLSESGKNMIACNLAMNGSMDASGFFDEDLMKTEVETGSEDSRHSRQILANDVNDVNLETEDMVLGAKYSRHSRQIPFRVLADDMNIAPTNLGKTDNEQTGETTQNIINPPASEDETEEGKGTNSTDPFTDENAYYKFVLEQYLAGEGLNLSDIQNQDNLTSEEKQSIETCLFSVKLLREQQERWQKQRESYSGSMSGEEYPVPCPHPDDFDYAWFHRLKEMEEQEELDRLDEWREQNPEAFWAWFDNCDLDNPEPPSYEPKQPTPEQQQPKVREETVYTPIEKDKEPNMESKNKPTLQLTAIEKVIRKLESLPDSPEKTIKLEKAYKLKESA